MVFSVSRSVYFVSPLEVLIGCRYAASVFLARVVALFVGLVKFVNESDAC